MTVRLDRIHAAVFRQSSRAPHTNAVGPQCFVHFAELSRDSRFLKAYINEATGLASHVIPYDATGRAPGDKNYVGPSHFAVVCSAGHIDFIADSIVLE